VGAAEAAAAAPAPSAPAPGGRGGEGSRAVCLLDPALCTSIELTVGHLHDTTSTCTSTGSGTSASSSALSITTHPLLCASFSEALTTLFGPLEVTTDEATLTAALPEQLRGLRL
jgi:hypothetical protein